MKFEFDFSEENKRKYSSYLRALDKKALEVGLKKTSFGIYEGKIFESKFDDFIFFTLVDNVVYENAIYCYIYEDINSLEKEDALKMYKETFKKNKKRR